MTPSTSSNTSQPTGHPGPAPLETAPLDTASVGAPITRADMSFFPVYLHQGAVPEIRTGTQAGVAISEQDVADVPTLLAANHLGVPVLLVEGETLEGGQQHRTINVSVLVPAHSTLDLPVSCVEAGRWHGERTFGRSRVFATRTVRSATLRGVHESVRSGGERRSNQGEVWGAVTSELRSRDIDSRTQALHDLEDRADADRHYDRAVRSLVRRGPLPGQCGVVVAFGSTVLGAELFAGPDLLAAHWEAIVRTALLERVGSDTRPRGRPSATAALKFVRRLGTVEGVDNPGVGLGRERHVRNDRLVGQVLTWDSVVVHASAFALAA